MGYAISALVLGFAGVMFYALVNVATVAGL